ncbi:MAG TPA: DPP IV N-terminal domain-containing protein [Gemmatimonadota bacterium]|nr:DPP IV N-terminal domain-containing protein [Gemmatimonadota bacterium]
MSRLGSLSFVLFLAVPASSVLAQTPTRPSPDSLYNAYMNFASLVRGGSVQAHWMQDGSSFWYADGAPDSTIIYKVDPEANTRVPLIDPEGLRRALTPLLGHESPGRGLPFETFEFLDDEKSVKFTVEGKEYVLRLDTYDVGSSPAVDEIDAIPPAVPRFPDWPARLELPSPDGRWVLVSQNENLWLRSISGGRAVQLTSDGDEGYEWGGFGWWPPTWASWSPDGERIVVKKVDWRRTPKLLISCLADSSEDVRWLRYRSVDQPVHVTELHVLDVPDGRSVSIDPGNDPEPYYVSILGWQADGSKIFLQRTYRWLTRVELLAADPTTGKTELLYEERSELPINPQFTLLADGKRFIRLSPYPSQSDYTGTARLYLHDIDGGLIRVLTPDTLPAVSVIGVDEATGWLYWRGRTSDPRADAHLYRVSLDGMELRRLTEGEGYHNVQLAPSKRFFIDNHNSTARPPSAELRSVEGTLLQTLSTADITDLVELGWSPPEPFVVKAADGTTDIFGGLYKPNDFDPEKKYPVIQTIYAHPFTDDAPRGFSPGWGSDQGRALAQLGFITVRMDWRGFRGFGTAREPIYGNIGRYEVADHVAALRQLAAERSYMDLGRVGIFGRSYGGYTAVRAMLQAPDFYKVGVATSPITDLAEHPFNEVWMGPIETHREAYEYASNIPLAKNLQGKLLLIHGTCDSAVPLSHTMRIIEEFARAGRPYDLVLLPGEGHDSFGSHDDYWLDAIRRYFVEHLKP